MKYHLRDSLSTATHRDGTTPDFHTQGGTVRQGTGTQNILSGLKHLTRRNKQKQSRSKLHSLSRQNFRILPVMSGGGGYDDTLKR